MMSDIKYKITQFPKILGWVVHQYFATKDENINTEL